MKFLDGSKYVEVYDELGNIITEGTIKHVAKELEVCVQRIYPAIKKNKLLDGKYEVCEVGVIRKIYSVYKGNELLCSGTSDELARRLNKKERYIKFGYYPTTSRNKLKCHKENNITITIAHEEPHIVYF